METHEIELLKAEMEEALVMYLTKFEQIAKSKVKFIKLDRINVTTLDDKEEKDIIKINLEID